MRSVSIRKQITTIITVAHQFIFYFCIISTVFQLFYGKNSLNKTIESSKQAHNAKKTESVKNRIVCSNLNISNTSGTPKILRNQENLKILYINLLQEELVFDNALVKNENCFDEHKSFCFQQGQTTITQEDPKGFTWHKH